MKLANEHEQSFKDTSATKTCRIEGAMTRLKQTMELTSLVVALRVIEWASSVLITITVVDGSRHWGVGLTADECHRQWKALVANAVSRQVNTDVRWRRGLA
jgi:hypothetical protein